MRSVPLRALASLLNPSSLEGVVGPAALPPSGVVRTIALTQWVGRFGAYASDACLAALAPLRHLYAEPADSPAWSGVRVQALGAAQGASPCVPLCGDFHVHACEDYSLVAAYASGGALGGALGARGASSRFAKLCGSSWRGRAARALCARRPVAGRA